VLRIRPSEWRVVRGVGRGWGGEGVDGERGVGNEEWGVG